jgi:hypothetical protein
MVNKIIWWLGVSLILGLSSPLLSYAQQKDDKEPKKENGFSKKVASRVKDLIFQNPGDTIMNKKSESSYKQYEGRTIRTITINHVGFERNINDTTRYKVVNAIVRLGNSLHGTTKYKVIRNNLFIKENTPLDPYKLADNERYLRDLNFILDARILVKPVKGKRDMVDLVVLTRDVFSLGGSFSPSSEERARFSFYDANIAGWGQRAQFSGVADSQREPTFGYQLLYNKNSIGGSLINATVSYTQINTGASYGMENENALYLRFDRPLVSAYTRWAGGAEFSRNWSENVFNIEETEFRNYTYTVRDFWAGYNIGIKNHITNRNRHFAALRTFNQRFSEQPFQSIEEFSPLYNNLTYVLGSFTFYNQNFYRTKYIYGFGRTEDVPYGRRVTLVAGPVTQLNITRPYFGADFDKSIVSKKGDFQEYSVKVGGYKNKEWEDIVVLASASIFSKLIPLKNSGLRQSVGISYAQIFNNTIILPLRIDNDFGINGFLADSLLGTKRLALHTESVLFMRPSILGFKFAPFIFADAAIIAKSNEDLLWQAPYYGLGGGLRTRNENLIFGTIELRMFYFPRVTEDLSKFRITLSGNLRIKYSSSFVKAPALITYN